MKTFFTFAFVLTLAQPLLATEFGITCQSENIKLTSEKNVTLAQSQNNWLTGIITLNYQVTVNGSEYKGKIPAQVNWSSTPNSSGNALYVALMTEEEKALREEYEGGSVGFAAIDSRDNTSKDVFSAKFTLIEFEWPGIGQIDELHNEPLECSLIP